MSSFSNKIKPMRNASELRTQVKEKIESDRARLCPNVTQSSSDQLGCKSPESPMRDEFLLWEALDEFERAMSDMIDGDTYSAGLFFIDVREPYEFSFFNPQGCVYEFLSGDWQPDYNEWLDWMRGLYSDAPTEAERIDNEARDYQSRWEKEHGRQWPARHKTS
jgi:hypothetical protein